MENNVETVNRKISDIYDAMCDLNIYKNTQYGNIGSQPLNLFARYMSKDTPALNGIYQRLDDKLSRVKNCPDDNRRIIEELPDLPRRHAPVRTGTGQRSEIKGIF